MKFIAKTVFGLETILAEELRQLGASHTEIRNRAVAFEGDKAVLYKANLWSRTALKILYPIREFGAANPHVLYKRIQSINWVKYLDLDETFAIDSTVNSPHFRHSQYVALKVKDAIVDQFRTRFGRRPSIDTQQPDLRLHIHIADKHCTLSLDSSGASLHKRGYRRQSYKAPLNEVLAAGLVLLSGWQADRPLVDPLCGSGTILAEAALIAQNIPPAFRRSYFGFQQWTNYDAKLWKNIRQEAEQQRQSFTHQLYGSDQSAEAIEMAKESLAGDPFDVIQLTQSRFQDYIPPPPPRSSHH